MKRLLLVLICLMPLPLLASPAAYLHGGPHGGELHSGLAEPATVLREGIETLTGHLDGQRQGMHPGELQRFLEQEIAPYFDFEHMAWWAAGPLNRHLNPPQRARLAAMLQQRFMQAMAEQLMGYRHVELFYLPPRGNPRQGDVTLGVRVRGSDAPPVQLDFRLYRNQAGQWRVYDVMANGLSAVAHYRAELARMTRQHGVAGMLQGLDRQD